MKRKAMITWFIIVFVICFTGIVASTVMIDNLIDSYIEEIKTEVNIEVINNTNSEVTVEDKNGNIKVYINPETEEEVVTEETTVFEQKEVTVESSGCSQYIPEQYSEVPWHRGKHRSYPRFPTSTSLLMR